MKYYSHTLLPAIASSLFFAATVFCQAQLPSDTPTPKTPEQKPVNIPPVSQQEPAQKPPVVESDSKYVPRVDKGAGSRQGDAPPPVPGTTATQQNLPRVSDQNGAGSAEQDMPAPTAGTVPGSAGTPAKSTRPQAEALLQSGPMVCYSQMREVMLWAQTKARATVRIVYWAKDEPERRYATAPVQTEPASAFTAHLVADSVTPGKRYTYELQINGSAVARPYPLEFQSQALWQWRTDPPQFTIAMGSCAYINDTPYDRPGRQYGGSPNIFTSIHKKHPDAMLWLGDYVYLREADWYTRTGILYRYTHDRSIPEVQALLGSTHNYAIWDDHDYGPNDADRGYVMKSITREAFTMFWGNPTYGTDKFGGICTTFEWGDAQFFLLDDRWERSGDTRTTGKRQILGDEQIEWLIDNLSFSKAAFKVIVIGGQVLNPLTKYETYATFPEERAKLLKLIADEKIPGVMFVSGDRHISELTMLPRPGTYPLYDLTVSPLTSGSGTDSTEANTLRVPGTWVGKQNFATMQFSGTAKNRTMTITLFDTDGKELWRRDIKAAELQ